MESMPVAKILQTLINIHQTLLCAEQEWHFRALLQAQTEDRQVIWSLIQPVVTPAAIPTDAVTPHYAGQDGFAG